MTAAAWQLEGSLARLADASFAGRIDVARPGDGLILQVGAGTPCRILGVLLDDHHPLDVSRLEAYVRGADLVAVYDEAPPRRLRAQVYWRRLDAAEFAPSHASHVVAAFDLIVSVNTSLLDTDPQASIVADIPAATDALNVRIVGDQWQARPLNAATTEITSDVGAGCFLFRLAHGPFTYVEMVHPADFHRATFAFHAAGGGSAIVEGAGDTTIRRARIAHPLFQQRLEKGVILRARVRAALVAQNQDEPAAIAAYQHFAAAEPPLTV